MNIDIIIFLLFINITSFFICMYDKYLSKRRKYRISEKLLILFCLLGGAVGFLLASKIFRHKIKKIKIIILAYFTSIIWFLLLVYTIV